MEYIGVKEAAGTWGISARMVLYHCTNGRIKGAQKVSNVWLIPKDSVRPEDRRKRNGRKSSKIKGEKL